MTLGEFRSLTKDIDDDAEIYFDTIELRTGLLGLAILKHLHQHSTKQSSLTVGGDQTSCQQIKEQEEDIYGRTDKGSAV